MDASRLEFLRGTLDVLKALVWGPLHGYAITSLLRRQSDDALLLEEGTLYPALWRLENKGLLEAEWGLSENKPTFTPVAGTYTSPQSVTIADSTDASIYYTTDGSTPGAGTGTSTLYNGTAISVAKSETINAIGVLVGYANSAVAAAA